MSSSLIAALCVGAAIAALAWMAVVMIRDAFLRAAKDLEDCLTFGSEAADRQAGQPPIPGDDLIGVPARALRWTELDDRQVMRFLDATSR